MWQKRAWAIGVPCCMDRCPVRCGVCLEPDLSEYRSRIASESAGQEV